MTLFNYKGRQFYKDGKPVRIISGAMHYFRVLPEYWEDRMLKLKAMGCNTLETYVAWKLHEPAEGEFNFEGILDISKYIQLAGRLGLDVIVRPGPYICAEFDFGGFPGWLLKDKEINLRCYDEKFLSKVDAFFDVLIEKVTPLQCTKGGPVVAVQVENEYGAYGNDKAYLRYIRDGLIDRGVDVMLFTSDNPEHHMLQGGSIPGVLMTLNFGSGPEERFPILDEYQQESPYLCAEFWIGWFDAWGGKHNTGAPAKEVADTLDKMLYMGASINFYMFHGGTNFGFTNGANKNKSSYEPDVTSYDYGALLDEAGDPTEKYYLCRDVIAKYVEGVDTTKKFVPTKKKSYGKVELTGQVNLFSALDMLSTPIKKTVPVSMELVDQDMGFIHYTTFLSGPRKEEVIYIQEIRDRALLFINRKLVKTFQYNEDNEGFKLTVPKEGLTIDILVESMGRVNYGPLMKDYKGITEGVRYANQFLFDWTIYSLPLDNIEKLRFEPIRSVDGPIFFKGLLEVDEIADTFITLNNFTKGNVFINGFNLGRYWDIGPQRTLYVPAPLLKKGKNEIVVFELHSTKEAVVEFNDRLILE